MAVCKFWLQGRCKFGDRCRYEHPGSAASADGAWGGSEGRGVGGGPPRHQRHGAPAPTAPPSRRHHFSRAELLRLCQEELHFGLWPLSGVGGDAEASVVRGDTSPEELRESARLAARSGVGREAIVADERRRFAAQRAALSGGGGGGGGEERDVFAAAARERADGSILGQVRDPFGGAPAGGGHQPQQLGAVWNTAAGGGESAPIAAARHPFGQPHSGGGGGGGSDGGGGGGGAFFWSSAMNAASPEAAAAAAAPTGSNDPFGAAAGVGAFGAPFGQPSSSPATAAAALSPFGAAAVVGASGDRSAPGVDFASAFSSQAPAATPDGGVGPRREDVPLSEQQLEQFNAPLFTPGQVQ